MGGRTCFEIPKLAESDEKRIRGLSVFLFPSFTLSSAMLVYDIPGVARAVVEGITAPDVTAMIRARTRTENFQNVPDGKARHGLTPRVCGVTSSGRASRRPTGIFHFM